MLEGVYVGIAINDGMIVKVVPHNDFEVLKEEFKQYEDCYDGSGRSACIWINDVCVWDRAIFIKEEKEKNLKNVLGTDDLTGLLSVEIYDTSINETHVIEFKDILEVEINEGIIVIVNTDLMWFESTIDKVKGKFKVNP